jgi:cytidylate kinase
MEHKREEGEQKMVICICGMAGCGKSTLAKRLAKKYGIKYFSGGDALKALAIEIGYKAGGAGWWETDEGRKFLGQRIGNPEFDRKVDEKLLEWAKHGNVVLDSWTMPWLLKEGFKVWLEVSQEERAKRIAKRDDISPEMALKALKEKDEKTKTIYKKLYGFNLGEDLSPFDMVLDTNQLKANEVFRVICMTIDRLCIRKN